MIDTDKIDKLLNGRISYHPDDPRIQERWREMATLLTVDEEEVIQYFSQCSETYIYYLSEIFDDLSEHYQSRAFVDFLKTLQTKFPNVDLSVDIRYAEMALKDI